MIKMVSPKKHRRLYNQKYLFIFVFQMPEVKTFHSVVLSLFKKIPYRP